MTSITDIVLVTSLLDISANDLCPAVAMLNSCLLGTGVKAPSMSPGHFVRVDHLSGGGWYPQMPTWRAHFNDLDGVEFATAVVSAPWQDPEAVRFLVLNEGDQAPALFTMEDMRAVAKGAFELSADGLARWRQDAFRASQDATARPDRP